MWRTLTWQAAGAGYHRGMKKLVRAGLFGLGGLAVLAAAALGGGSWWVKKQFDREAVVRQLEAAWQAKVTLDSSSLEIWSSPARWRLGGLTVSALQPPEGAPTTPVLRLKEAVLEVSLIDLLSGTLDVRRLTLDGLEANEYLSPEGASHLQAALVKPKQPVPAAAGDKAAKPAEKPLEKKKPAVFQADRLGMTVRVHEARIQNGRLYIHNRVNKTKTRLENLNFALSGIDIDPTNLKEHNSAAVELSAKLTLEGRGKVAGEMQDVRFAFLDLAGSGSMRPFDPATAEWNPLSEWELVLAQGSALAGYMTLGQADADAAKKLKDFGLDVSDLPMGGELSEPAVLRMAFQDNRITIKEDTRFVMPGYEVRMAGGSWLNSAEDAQDLGVRLICGAELDRRLRTAAQATGLPEAVAESVFKAFQDETTQRLAFDVRATGQLTKPKISANWDKALERLLKGGGVDSLLRGLIK